MFCENCGEQIHERDKFCIYCGERLERNVMTMPTVLSPIPGAKKAWVAFPLMKYILTVFAFGMTSYFVFIVLSDEPSEAVVPEIVQEEEIISALNELGPLMEPVGYFSDMDKFESDLNLDQWYSLVRYVDIDETPITQENMTFASVVKIVCENEDTIVYGSGTNVDRFGYVLTNYHVVEGFAEDACMVGFPDPRTGLIREAYWTTIITDKENITGHDLAYLSVENPIFDLAGNLYGYREKIVEGTLPYFAYATECVDNATQLGDELLILGYPPLSGGSLTITSGLVSSLYSPDGYIVTSAKILSGNSGGLAVNSNGCYVGVPTAVYYDEQDMSEEVFGEIIDAEFVFEFDQAIEDDLQEYYNGS